MSGGVARPLRAALLGTGAWAGVLVRAAAQSPAIDIACCWSRTPERVRAFAAANGIEPRADIQSILDDRRIEAVIIALPNDQHRPYATLAARHGKHLFIEKPIAHLLEDGLAIAALEALHGVRIVVGHCARLLAGNRRLRVAVERGELGRISSIEASFCNDRGLRLTPQDWRWYQASAPGGCLSQIAIHQLDTLRAIGGPIDTIAARSARLASTGAEVEDQWMITVGFADGKLGSVLSSWTSAGRYEVRASGDSATMTYAIDQSLWSDAERLHEGAVLDRVERGSGHAARTGLDVAPGNMFREELELFAASARDNEPCELSAHNACLAVAAVDAAIASASDDGRAVRIDDVMVAAHARMMAAAAPDARS